MPCGSPGFVAGALVASHLGRGLGFLENRNESGRGRGLPCTAGLLPFAQPPKFGCCLLSPFPETSRSAVAFPGVGIKSALSEVALAFGAMDGGTDGTKMILWGTSPRPLLSHNPSSVGTPVPRVPGRDADPALPSPLLQQMPGAAQLPPLPPQGLRPDSQGVGKKFSSRHRRVSAVPM